MILARGEKYGRDIRDEYEKRSQQSMPLGSIYTTLERMIDKNLITGRLGESENIRGGNRRKYYKLTSVGIKSINAVRKAMSPQ